MPFWFEYNRDKDHSDMTQNMQPVSKFRDRIGRMIQRLLRGMNKNQSVVTVVIIESPCSSIEKCE